MRRALAIGLVIGAIVLASIASPGHALILALGLAAGPWLYRAVRPAEPAPVRSLSAGAKAAASQPDAFAVADALPLPLIGLDRRQNVAAANSRAREALPALTVGAPLSFAVRDPQVLDAIARVLSSGAAETIGLTLRGAAEQHFACTIAPVAAAENMAVLLTLRDVSDVRAMEAAHVDFVANASHELRTPLASVLGLIETIQGPARTDPHATARFLAIMQSQAQRMSRLVDDLLSLSRVTLNEHRQPTGTVDLNALADGAVLAMAGLAREKGVELAVSRLNGPALVPGERDELASALDNLIENAIKYGRSGGRVDVTVEATAGTLELSVRDYGQGIAPEHLPRLTERFYRVDSAVSRTEGGTGLGLALVKHTMNRHRGRLTIRSAPGEGATFTLIFPRAALS